MRQLYTLLHTLIPTAAILATFLACSSDDVTDAGTSRPGKGVCINLHIGTTPQGQDNSRATWSDQMARDGEMIKTCYVVMTKEETVGEICDLIYHTLVMMVDQNITIEDVEAVLQKRAEKAGNLKKFHQVDKNS